MPAKQEAMAVPRRVTYTAEDKARYEALREKNEGRLAPKERFLTTTAQKVVLTFGGLTRKESVEDILDHLDRMGVKATFFVTELELRKYTDTVREIAARGHELGLGLRTGTDGDCYETCAQIERLQKNMQRLLGVRPVIARQVFGREIPTVNEAASAMGIELLGQTVNMVQTKDKEAKKVEDISDHLFGRFILAMTEKLENAELLALALHRIENGAFSQTKDWDEVRKELGISSEDIADVDDAEVEFE